MNYQSKETKIKKFHKSKRNKETNNQRAHQNWLTVRDLVDQSETSTYRLIYLCTKFDCSFIHFLKIVIRND